MRNRDGEREIAAWRYTERDREREKEKEIWRGRGRKGETTVENGTEKKGKSVSRVEALAAQKARMQAKKEERDEETGFFQLGQVGASNLGTAASLRE